MDILSEHRVVGRHEVRREIKFPDICITSFNVLIPSPVAAVVHTDPTDTAVAPGTADVMNKFIYWQV